MVEMNNEVAMAEWLSLCLLSSPQEFQSLRQCFGFLIFEQRLLDSIPLVKLFRDERERKLV